jgi:hypothetical protein
MTTFLTIHRAPGLSAEEIEGNAPLVAESRYATFRDLFVNLPAGFLLSIYEADDRAALEREFERVGFPWDEINEVQYSVDAATMQARLATGPAS